MKKTIGNKQFHEAYPSGKLIAIEKKSGKIEVRSSDRLPKGYKAVTASFQIFSIYELTKTEMNPKELLFYQTTAKKIFSDKFHQTTKRGLWDRSISALNNLARGRGLQSTDHILSKILSKPVVFAPLELKKEENSVSSSTESNKKDPDLERAKTDKDFFLQKYSADSIAFSDLLVEFDLTCMNSLTHFFTQDHWNSLKVDQITALDFTHFTSSDYEKMTASRPNIQELLPGLPPICKPYIIAYRHTALLDPSKTDQEFFLTDYPADSKAFSDLVKEFDLSCMNQLYPLFTQDHWNTLKVDQILSVDFTHFTRNDYEKMTSSRPNLQELIPGLPPLCKPYIIGYAHTALLDPSKTAKEFFLTECPADSIAFKALLKEFDSNCMNRLIPFFTQNHWGRLSVSQITSLDFTHMNQQTFSAMCPSMGGTPIGDTSEILSALTIPQLNYVYPYLINSVFWEYISFKKISELNLEAMTQESFNKMCPRNGQFLSIRGGEVLKSLKINQLNQIYPLFSSSDYWRTLEASIIPKLDFIKMNQASFHLLCPTLSSGGLSPWSIQILKSLQTNQLNIVYPYFTQDRYWNALSDDQIVKLDFTRFTNSHYQDMTIVRNNLKALLNKLTNDQLRICKPYIISSKHESWLEPSRKTLI